MARMMPEARIVAADIDPRSLRLCLENAHINGVAERVAVLVGCRKPEELDRGEPRRLYIVDVEGGEVELLDPARCPALAKSDLIVECHDFFNPAIHNIVASRFKETHHLSLIQPAPPDPKDFPFLFALPMGVLLLAITENRPQPTTWLVGWAK
jgi:ribosomal protein L11 methylase PrmA